VGFQRTLGQGLANLTLETTVYRECIAIETWSFRLFYIILFALALTATPQLWGQQQATVSGVITDPSGAVIPGATVRVTNDGTQITTTAVTNPTGYYLAVNLIPGAYTVTVQKEGFKTVTRPGLILQVAQAATVDLRLELGSTSQEVSVNAVPPLLETSDPTLGQVIGPQTTLEMPLNGRNYFNLAALAPGVSTYGLRSSYSHASNDYGTSFNSGSGGEDRNGFTLDGADIKGYKTNISYVPSIDAIQEFKIETTPYSADLGTSAGAQILLVTKSGTDQFHGSAYEFLRNAWTNAYNYFADHNQPIPELIKNQFGGTFGGPIVKRKLFFFGNYEGQRERVGETFFGTVPTDQMRAGDFSQFTQAIYNPFTSGPCPTCTGGVTRQPFANNIIPAALISPVSTTFLKSQFPLPTSPGIANNFAGTGVDRNSRDQVNVRIDDSMPKDTLFGRFSFNHSGLYVARQTFGGAQLPGFGDNDAITTTDVTLADVHTFSPTLILQGQASYLRVRSRYLPQQLGNDLNATLGIQGVLPNIPFITNISGLANPGSDPYGPESAAINQFSYVGKLTKVLGKNTFKVGGEFDRWQVFHNASPSFPSGQFSFDGSFTKNPNAPSTVITGIPFADFLLGFPVSALTQTGYTGSYLFRNNARWWVNDEFRVTQNLILDLGLRWEYDGPFYLKYNNFSNFDVTTGQLVLPGQNGVNRSAGVQRDLHSYAPRFGFSYTLPGHQSTVLRGGYGIFYNIIQENITESGRTNPPFASFPQFIAGNTTEEVPTVSTENVFAPGNAAATPPVIGALAFNITNGYQQQATFGGQHQFGSSVVAELNYVWQKNTGLLATRNVNAPRQNGTFVLPYSEFGPIDQVTNIEYGNYNALQARLEKRFSHGVSSLTAFTWSKYLDNISSGDAEDAPGDPGFQNPYCFTCDYGRSSSDFERRLVQSWLYKVPYPTDRGPVARNLIGGWGVSGIFTYQSGFPVTPLVSFDNSESETFADRPNVIKGVPLFPAGTRTHTHWFNPGAFVVAPPLQFGNAGKGIIQGPNLINLDAAVMRNFQLTERFNLEFRAEAFNVANHPNFSDPNPFIDIPSEVGSITATTTTSRQLQFALKLTF
jgi:hypothetical protein